MAPRNTIRASKTTADSKPAPSTTPPLSSGREKLCVTEITSSGATTKVPTMSPNHPVNQPGAQQCFHRVADGNAQIDDRTSGRSNVDQKRTQENSRPQPIAPQEQ